MLRENNKYKVLIESSFLKNGSMDYGESLLKGRTKKEIFFTFGNFRFFKQEYKK